MAARLRVLVAPLVVVILLPTLFVPGGRHIVLAVTVSPVLQPLSAAPTVMLVLIPVAARMSNKIIELILALLILVLTLMF